MIRCIQQAAATLLLGVTTEAYPYTAASTLIQSSLFDGDWQSAYGISCDGLQWQAAGERLTEQSFNEYRRQGGVQPPGIAVVDGGALVADAYPGQAIRGRLPDAGPADPG